MNRTLIKSLSLFGVVLVLVGCCCGLVSDGISVYTGSEFNESIPFVAFKIVTVFVLFLEYATLNGEDNLSLSIASSALHLLTIILAILSIGEIVGGSFSLSVGAVIILLGWILTIAAKVFDYRRFALIKMDPELAKNH